MLRHRARDRLPNPATAPTTEPPTCATAPMTEPPTYATEPTTAPTTYATATTQRPRQDRDRLDHPLERLRFLGRQ